MRVVHRRQAGRARTQEAVAEIAEVGPASA